MQIQLELLKSEARRIVASRSGNQTTSDGVEKVTPLDLLLAAIQIAPLEIGCAIEEFGGKPPEPPRCHSSELPRVIPDATVVELLNGSLGDLNEDGMSARAFVQVILHIDSVRSACGIESKAFYSNEQPDLWDKMKTIRDLARPYALGYRLGSRYHSHDKSLPGLLTEDHQSEFDRAYQSQQESKRLALMSVSGAVGCGSLLPYDRWMRSMGPLSAEVILVVGLQELTGAIACEATRPLIVREIAYSIDPKNASLLIPNLLDSIDELCEQGWLSAVSRGGEGGLEAASFVRPNRRIMRELARGKGGAPF